MIHPITITITVVVLALAIAAIKAMAIKDRREDAARKARWAAERAAEQQKEARERANRRCHWLTRDIAEMEERLLAYAGRPEAQEWAKGRIDTLREELAEAQAEFESLS